MGIVDQDKLRDNYHALVDRLGDSPAAGQVRPRVSVTLTEDVTSESTFEQYGLDFQFKSDEAVERAGRGLHPSPMRYFLSGVAFCQAGWYAKGSAVVGVEIDSLTVDLETLLDMRGEHHVEGIDANPAYLALTARIGTSAPVERVLEMVDWGDARCPLWVLVNKAIPTYQRIIVDDVMARDTFPDALAAT